jgi:hypothetical protein
VLTSLTAVVTVYSLTALGVWILFTGHAPVVRAAVSCACLAVVVLCLLALNGDFWLEQHFMGGARLRVRLEGRVPVDLVQDLLPSIVKRMPFRLGDIDDLDYESRPIVPLSYDALVTMERVPAIAFYVSRSSASREVLVCVSPWYLAWTNELDEAVRYILGPGPPPPGPTSPYSGVPR